MTPLDLQDELVAEIEKILDGYLYKTPEGERIPMNVFSQGIPVPATPAIDEEMYEEMYEEMDEDDPVPYTIVRLSTGEEKGYRDSKNSTRLVIIIGTYDDGPENQGHRDVMNIIQKIYERFFTNPCLNGKAVFDKESGFQWKLQEDTYYPYFFGACTLVFNIAAIRREDMFV